MVAARRKKKPARKAPPILRSKPALRLDLGSGPKPASGFTGVDVIELPGVERFDLLSGESWPWDDGTVDELRASHFIEHIEKRWVTGENGLPQHAFFRFFDEAFRVAKDGATFQVIWPALQSVRAFMDPTHCDYIPLERMLYLSKSWRAANVPQYNAACDWAMVSGVPITSAANSQRAQEVQAIKYQESWNFTSDFVVVLKAIKSEAARAALAQPQQPG